ncbi:MAG: hypothetical protein EA422_00115 [Gemmatimonadales bacterium]|nr:MAG: hypothetical protein EA422_00115 [Gemmatimonadales bacterium]
MTEPAAYAIDLEELVGRTAVAAPRDYRALAVATTWIAEHSQLVNVRRLGKVAGELEETPSAILGAMIEIARETNSAADRLGPVQRHCRPLKEPRALFDRTQANPLLLRFAKEGALPAFKTWGLWQDEWTLKFDAIRPVSWILEHCPELRLRAIYGPGLEAEVMQVLGRGRTTIAAIAREVDASYSATHAAVARLEGRGSVVSHDGHGVELSTPVRSWIEGYSAVARRHREQLAS